MQIKLNNPHTSFLPLQSIHYNFTKGEETLSSEKISNFFKFPSREGETSSIKKKMN